MLWKGLKKEWRGTKGRHKMESKLRVLNAHMFNKEDTVQGTYKTRS